MEMLQRLGKWAIWTVVVSVVPIIYCMIVLKNHGKLDLISTPWARGELLLISVIVVATSMGDLASARGTIPMRGVVTGFAVIYLLIFGFCYGDILCSVALNQSFDENLVRYWSPYIFGLSLIIGGACVMLSKEAD